jgi:AcrR family transcriptional regulator
VKTKPELSRAAIVERALTIADAEGLEAITVRRISQEFGVTPMALYWHVANKDALLEAMGDALFEGVAPAVDPSRPWTEQLRSVMDALVAGLRRHPGSVSLAFSRVLLNDAGRDLAERVFDLLREAGFSVRETADIGSHALRTAVMLVDGEPGRAIGGTAEEREAIIEHKRAAISSLPAARYPRIREMGEAMLDCDDQDDYYEFGVATFVAGVRALQPA